jgi:hypothetical protein
MTVEWLEFTERTDDVAYQVVDLETGETLFEQVAYPDVDDDE